MIKLRLPSQPEYALTLPLALLCLVLGSALIIESAVMRRGDSVEAPSAAQPNAEMPASENETNADFELPPIDAFSAFVDRPLFLEGRKPPAEVEAAPAPKEEDLAPLALTLMGVMLSHRGELAILAEASGKNRRVKLGGSISGWRLIALKPDHVTLQRGQEKRDLPLMKPRPKGAQGNAAAPGQPPGGAGLPPGVRRPLRAPPPPEPAVELNEPEVEEIDDASDMDEPPEGEAQE